MTATKVERVVWPTVLTFALTLGVHAAGADMIFESFETGFGQWQAQGAIDLPDPSPWEWSVTRTQDQASDGTWSLDFTADGSYDDGTVWIERTLTLPAGTWDIGVQFDFWAQYDAQVGTWQKVAFIGTFDPEQTADFTVVGLEDTAGWTQYSHAETVVLDDPGTVWVAVGYHVVFETPSRTHYFDAVTITGVPPQGQPVPALSLWGTLVMLALLLSTAIIVIRSRGSHTGEARTGPSHGR
jgi:hypothetical protein